MRNCVKRLVETAHPYRVQSDGVELNLAFPDVGRHPRGVGLGEQVVERLLEDFGWGDADELLRVRAALHNPRRISRIQYQQHTVRLNHAGNMNRLAVAVGKVDWSLHRHGVRSVLPITNGQASRLRGKYQASAALGVRQLQDKEHGLARVFRPNADTPKPVEQGVEHHIQFPVR